MLPTRFPAILLFTVALIYARIAAPSAAQRFQPALLFKVGGPSTPSQYDVRVYGVQGGSSDADAVKRAIQRTFDRMATLWKSKISIDVAVRFKDLRDSSVHARSKVRFRVADDKNKQEVQTAAYEAIFAQKLSGMYDIDITVNNRTNWHYDDIMPPADKMDLSTVIMRETYHNLMFSGNIRIRKRPTDNVTEAYLKNDIPSRFDKFLVNKQGCPVLGYLKDEKLQRDLGVTGGQLLFAALTNGELYVHRKKPAFKIKIHAPRKFDKKRSIYHTAKNSNGVPSLMRPNLVAGQRLLNPSRELLVFQSAYVTRIPGARECDYALSNPYRSGSNSSNAKSRKKIGGLPRWAFGLCMVLLFIVLVILLFGICTIGAVAKQKETPSFWKRITCCCTGVETVPDKPVFMLIDQNAAKKAQSARNSLGAATAAMRTDATSSAQEQNAERSREHSLLSAAAETQLPARFYK